MKTRCVFCGGRLRRNKLGEWICFNCGKREQNQPLKKSEEKDGTNYIG